MTTDIDSEPTATSLTDPVHIDGRDHLDDVVRSDDVVLVDCFAEWCGPCKLLEPVLDDLAGTTDATIVTVDVDQHPQIDGDYGVRSVPTLVHFAGGEAVEQHTGLLSADRLRQLIDDYTE